MECGGLRIGDGIGVHLAHERDERRARQQHDAEVAREVPHLASEAPPERFAEPSMDGAEENCREKNSERQQQEPGAGGQPSAWRPSSRLGLRRGWRRSLVWQHAPRVTERPRRLTREEVVVGLLLGGEFKHPLCLHHPVDDGPVRLPALAMDLSWLPSHGRLTTKMMPGYFVNDMPPF